MAEGVGFLDLHRRPMKSLLTTRGVGQICYWAISGEGIPRVDSTDQADQADQAQQLLVLGPRFAMLKRPGVMCVPGKPSGSINPNGRWLMTIPQLWETNPWFLTAPRIFGSMVGWAMWGLCPLSTVAVEKRLKMWQQNLSGFYHGWWWRIHRPRHLSLLVFVTSHVWKREKIAMLDPLSKFRDAGGGAKEREKWSPTTLMIQASLFSPHDTFTIFIVPSLSSFWWLDMTCLSCHVVFLHFLGSSSDSAPGASCDRSKLSSSKVPPQIWAKGMSLAQKKRRKAMDLPAK